MPQRVPDRGERSGSRNLVARYMEDARRLQDERAERASRGAGAPNGTALGEHAADGNGVPPRTKNGTKLTARQRAANGVAADVGSRTPRGVAPGASAAGSAADQLPARIREMVEPHLFFVVQVAGEFRSSDVPLEELVAEGNMGLVEAAHRFDSSHGVKFLSYAAWWIRKRMLEYLSVEGRPVHLTRYARERRRDLRAVHEVLRSSLGREPTFEELASASGLHVDTVVQRSMGHPKMLSLDNPVPHLASGLTIMDRLVDVPALSIEDRIDGRRFLARVRGEIARLPRRERTIIENRFGLDGREPLTFQDLGSLLGLSRERARQLERDALARLRRRLDKLPRRTGSRRPSAAVDG